MNEFNIGDVVWAVSFIGGQHLTKCLVTSIYCSRAKEIGIGEELKNYIKAIRYDLNPIHRDEDGEQFIYSDDEESFTCQEEKIFKDKEDAFIYLENSILELRMKMEKL